MSDWLFNQRWRHGRAAYRPPEETACYTLHAGSFRRDMLAFAGLTPRAPEAVVNPIVIDRSDPMKQITVIVALSVLVPDDVQAEKVVTFIQTEDVVIQQLVGDKPIGVSEAVVEDYRTVSVEENE